MTQTSFIRRVQAGGHIFVCPRKDRALAPNESACEDCDCIKLTPLGEDGMMIKLTRERIEMIRREHATLGLQSTANCGEIVALCDMALATLSQDSYKKFLAADRVSRLSAAREAAVAIEREGIIASIRASSWSGTEEIVTMIRARV